MPVYRYEALNLQGQSSRDLIQADSERQARQLLRERGLFARRLHLQADAAAAGGRWRLSHTQRCDLTRQLATLVGAAIPLIDALHTLERQTREAALRSLLHALAGRVGEGHTLAASLRHYPGCFDPLYCALVEAGERSGRLGIVLERLADYLEQVQKQRHKARTALVYPGILLLVSLAVVSGLMSFVVPKLTEQFSHSGQTLPWLTRLLMSLSDGLLLLGPWWLAGLGLALLAYLRLMRLPRWRLARDRWLLTLPRLGHLLQVLDSARLSRSLAILVGSGIPLLEALQVSRASVANRQIGEALRGIHEQVKAGVSLHQALAGSGHFPPLLINMVASGEASGTLGTMLERVADSQERSFAQQVDVLLALFEPLMILVMGGIVLFIVLAILLPIMQLNQSLGL